MTHHMGEILERISASSICRVNPPDGLPVVPRPLELPHDLVEFYTRCGGVTLFEGGEFSIRIPAKGEFVPSNLAVIGETGFGDRSDHWFVVGITSDHEYVSIDLDNSRRGRCYDSFHETHGVVGESRVIAQSFTDFLTALLSGGGSGWYWLGPDFPGLGDAYDG
ncbi:SMI1/KNR4 family protein [Streptomyces niveus]|uniref:SMI1/KNR4 family protein n=1 Tax=Streptomyces niveus TaxID=193462 RepID=UPI0036B0E9AF